MSITRRDLLTMTVGAAITSRARAQGMRLPVSAWDCHIHIIGPQNMYPMDPKRSYTPPESSISDLRAFRVRTGISRHVLIQPSFYGTDNRCMLDALATLGASARGVAVIGDDATDANLRLMHERGVRGVRLNLETAGERDPLAVSAKIKQAAARVAPLGWHLQLYAALELIAAAAPTIRAIEIPVVLDHFALATASKGIGQPGFDIVQGLVRDRFAFVKLSAPHRISSDAPEYRDVTPIAQALIGVAPDRMLWGSDWPHTVRNPDKGPFEIHPFLMVDDVHNLVLLKNWTGTEQILRTILVENPRKLYGFR
jgi:predicted TIM-barrel fold metal-dependent hydrolase